MLVLFDLLYEALIAMFSSQQSLHLRSACQDIDQYIPCMCEIIRSSNAITLLWPVFIHVSVTAIRSDMGLTPNWFVDKNWIY